MSVRLKMDGVRLLHRVAGAGYSRKYTAHCGLPVGTTSRQVKQLTFNAVALGIIFISVFRPFVMVIYLSIIVSSNRLRMYIRAYIRVHTYECT